MLGCGRGADGDRPLTAAERRAIPGVIAFVSERGDSKDIWLVTPSGVETRLTAGPEDDFPAAVRPDGGRLLAIATREIDGVHREQLRLVPLPGRAGPASIQPLHAPRGRARNPSFAPDGSFFIAESDARGFSDLVRMAPDAEPRPLTGDPRGSFEPSISPDGRRVAFVSSRDGNPELYVMDIAAATRTPDAGAIRLTHSPREDGKPSWSPDGRRLAFLARREPRRVRYYLIDPDAPEPDGTVVPLSGGAAGGDEHDLAWSPDGSAAVFVGRQHTGETRIYKLAPGHAEPLVEPTAEPVAITDGSMRADQPAWSPDGKYLVYVRSPLSPGASDAADLYLMRADGTGHTRLTRAPGADWLPRWAPAVSP